MRKLIMALAFGALLLPNHGLTLGLGEIEVTTALNQELNAEIELLSAAPEETESLIVKLASREDFQRAGLDRPYLLSSLKFSTVLRDGKPYIKITTDKPIREPFLNFLIEVDWPKGHLLREYTILLDPPMFMGGQPAYEARPAAAEQGGTGRTQPQPASSDIGYRPAAMGAATVGTGAAVTGAGAAPSQYRTVPASASGYEPASGYRIQAGDTLWSLAEDMRPDTSVSVEQMMLAMLKTNPEVFINENVNGLKRGYILRMPDRAAIDAVDQAEAVAMVRQQNALWREYQQALAEGRPASAMPGDASGPGAGLAGAGESRLAIVSAGKGVSAAGAKDPSRMTASELRAELALANEALESQRVQNEELQDQVSSLEGQVKRMQSLLTLEDTDLARMQGRPGEAAKGVLAEEEGIDLTEVDETGGITIEPVEEAAVEGEETRAEAGEAVFVDEKAQPSEAVAEQAAPVEEDYTRAPSIAPEYMPQEDGGLLGNPIILGGAGAGVLLLIALGVLIARRRKAAAAAGAGAAMAPKAAPAEKPTELEEVAEMVEEEAAEPAKKPAAAAEEPEEEAEEATGFESDSTMVLPSADDTIVTTGGELEEEEQRDDVIAEADVYLAYGIYQQAEELLQNAIKDHPDNDSYRVKLAETYFASKNRDAFIEVASDINQRRGGENTTAWKKIVAIGTELCPDHELFASADAGMVGELDMDDLMPKSPEPMDIDLGAEESGPAVPDLDFSFDEEPEAAKDKSVETAVLDFESEAGSTAILDLASSTEGEEEAEGLAFDLEDTGAAPEAKAKAAPAEEEFSLDIDASELDIQDEAEAEPAAAGEEEVGFDLGDLGAEAEAALPEEKAESEVSLDEIDESSLDFDIGAEEGPAEEAATAEEELDIEIPLEDAGMDFDLTEEAAVGAEEVSLEEMAEAEEAALEIGEESLAEEAVTEEPVAKPIEPESIEDELDLSELDDVDEVSTKLDLARAYLDMGDAEGTRSILDEVMAEGNEEQKKEAQELLNQL